MTQSGLDFDLLKYCSSKTQIWGNGLSRLSLALQPVTSDAWHAVERFIRIVAPHS